MESITLSELTPCQGIPASFADCIKEFANDTKLIAWKMTDPVEDAKIILFGIHRPISIIDRFLHNHVFCTGPFTLVMGEHRLEMEGGGDYTLHDIMTLIHNEAIQHELTGLFGGLSCSSNEHLSPGEREIFVSIMD